MTYLFMCSTCLLVSQLLFTFCHVKKNHPVCPLVGLRLGAPLGDKHQGQLLSSESAQMDLGFLVDNQLNFHDHARNATRKAGGVAHSFLKGTVYREPNFMVHILQTHIRPVLEYASTVWNIGYLQDLRRLESVQRLWTRQVKGLEEEDYETRLQPLDLYSVKGRLLRADMIVLENLQCDVPHGSHRPMRHVIRLSYSRPPVQDHSEKM